MSAGSFPGARNCRSSIRPHAPRRRGPLHGVCIGSVRGAVASSVSRDDVDGAPSGDAAVARATRLPVLERTCALREARRRLYGADRKAQRTEEGKIKALASIGV
jgi:hypothetical protein